MASPSKAERPATYDDANLLLRLYELRREEKLRQAREWFMKNFHARTIKEFQKVCPMGSQENAYARMVWSYWDMAASFVTSGVLHQDLFTQNSNELLFVWLRVSDFIALWRQRMENPHMVENLETVAKIMIEQKKQVGSFEAFRKMVQGA
jgi:hypothetical protein